MGYQCDARRTQETLMGNCIIYSIITKCLHPSNGARPRLHSNEYTGKNIVAGRIPIDTMILVTVYRLTVLYTVNQGCPPYQMSLKRKEKINLRIEMQDHNTLSGKITSQYMQCTNKIFYSQEQYIQFIKGVIKLILHTSKIKVSNKFESGICCSKSLIFHVLAEFSHHE